MFSLNRTTQRQREDPVLIVADTSATCFAAWKHNQYNLHNCGAISTWIILIYQSGTTWEPSSFSAAQNINGMKHFFSNDKQTDIFPSKAINELRSPLIFHLRWLIQLGYQIGVIKVLTCKIISIPTPGIKVASGDLLPHYHNDA